MYCKKQRDDRIVKNHIFMQRWGKVSISERYQANATFQSMRENYQTCVEALSNWDNIEFGETVVRRKEYGELNQSL